MRFLLILIFLFTVTPAMANPFETKPKETKPDYDKVPNSLSIGLGLQELDADMLLAMGVQGQNSGLAVTEVGGIAKNYKLDFKTGDVITHLSGEVVKSLKHYQEVVDRAKPNSEVVIRIFRSGVIKDIKLFRIHVFGINVYDSRIRDYPFDKTLIGCHIIKYNNTTPSQVKMKELYKAKFGVFLLNCNGKNRFVKLTKKKYLGYWSQLVTNKIADDSKDSPFI